MAPQKRMKMSSTPTGNSTIESPDAAAAVLAIAPSVKQGKNFLAQEDFLALQAYYQASENAIAGSRQKKTAFEKEVDRVYEVLRASHVAYLVRTVRRSSILEQSKDYELSLVHVQYPIRNGNSVCQRVVCHVIPEYTKFWCIMIQVSHEFYLYCSYIFTHIYFTLKNPMPSGFNKDAWLQKCVLIFKSRYGRDFWFMNCHDFLKEKIQFLNGFDPAPSNAIDRVEDESAIAATVATDATKNQPFDRPLLGVKAANRVKVKQEIVLQAVNEVVQRQGGSSTSKGFVRVGNILEGIAEATKGLFHIYTMQSMAQSEFISTATRLKVQEELAQHELDIFAAATAARTNVLKSNNNETAGTKTIGLDELSSNGEDSMSDSQVCRVQWQNAVETAWLVATASIEKENNTVEKDDMINN
jgi:hypothetical protein